VELGRRAASARLPRPLEGLRESAKRVVWTAVEARLVDTPVRYAIRELAGHREAQYRLKGSQSRFTVRHRSGDIDIFRKFYAYGYYEFPAEVTSRLQALGRPVEVLDLGANIGFFEVYTREGLEIGSVVCYEPDPSNSAVLERTREANGAGWEIRRACASNADGFATFETGQKNFSRISESGGAQIPVKDIFPDVAGRDLVKMNIEGSEWEVLEDPRLAQTATNWIVEYHAIANPRPDIHEYAAELFTRAGYEVRTAATRPLNGLIWAWK
jgi:FkbM family methyltransferase